MDEAKLIERLRGLLEKAIKAGLAVDAAPEPGEVRQVAIAEYHQASLQLQREAVTALPTLLDRLSTLSTDRGAEEAGDAQ